MNPLISELVSVSPFSPVDHIWFDLTDISGIEKKMGEKFPGQTLEDLVEGGLVEKFPLPFEKIAVAMSVPGHKYFVVTIERFADAMIFELWGKGFDGPASTVVVETYLNNLVMQFDPKYEKMMNKDGITDYREKHNAIVQILLFSFVVISHGYAPEINKTAYRCIANPKNIKRIKKGKKPLFEWETIVVESKPATLSSGLGGTHASPKPHDRRGHQRKLKSGRMVYVRPTTINKHKIKTEGFIHHDYRVAV